MDRHCSDETGDGKIGWQSSPSISAMTLHYSPMAPAVKLGCAPGGFLTDLTVRPHPSAVTKPAA